MPIDEPHCRVTPELIHAPYVLIPCDNRMIGGHPYHALGRKYSDAIRQAAGCYPLLLPTGGEPDLLAYLELADGILLTGSPANVHPSHFGQPVANAALPLDTERDSVTLPLVRLAIERELPLFAICRGLQETNVALGGSLSQAVHELPDRLDHRADHRADVQLQYEPSHAIDIVAGGQLERILGVRHLQVNSLHGQAIDRLAPGLRVEALAPDGTVEAVHVSAHPGFALAVQWHPEWKPLENPASRALFGAFGDACRRARARRTGARADADCSRAG